MILYHASTSYHVLCCIVHKLAYHNQEEAVFMVVEHMLPKEELQVFLNKLRGFSWFHQIISVPEGSFRMSHGKTLNQQSGEADILEVIHNICRAVDNWYPTGFQQFQKIYVASDQWSVGVYLLYHKIPYSYFEDASGMLGDQERYLTIIKNMNLSNYVICNYLKGAGRSDTVVEKLCDLRNQPMGFLDHRAVDFSIYHIVNRLPKQLVDDLLKLYGAKKYRFQNTEKILVFMTQFLRTLTIKNLAVQECITTLLLDYFGDGYTIVVKPHPKDRWINYHRVIPESIILDNVLPSELLPFVLEGNIHLVVTASSTSIGGMSKVASNAMSFGTDIEIHYERLHDMYVTAKVIERVYQSHKIITQNITTTYLEHFFKTLQFEPDSKNHTGSIYIDGGQYILGQSHKSNYVRNALEDIMIFLNYGKRYEFLLDSRLNHCYFIVIQIKIDSQRKDNHKYKKRTRKELWVYCEKEEIREIMLSLKESKTLKNSQLELEIESKEATYTMILEGKMKAMQYALRQKENEEQDPVYNKIIEVIKQYQENEINQRVLLEEEGVLHE